MPLSSVPRALLYCAILLLAAAPSYGQIPPDDRETPQPLRKIYASFEPVVKKPMKSMTSIVDKDTISKSLVDRAGNETVKLSYYKNQPTTRIQYTYTGKLMTGSRSFGNDILQSTTSSRYDPNGNLLEWTSTPFNYDKKTQQSTPGNERRWMIEWNKNNRVTRRYCIDESKTKVLPSEYTYDAAGKLTQVDEPQWKTIYVYQDSLLMQRSKVFKNDNSVTDLNEYQYNSDGLLIAASNKHEERTYGYDAGVLRSVSVRKKNDTTKRQEASLFYTDGLLSAVEIRYTDISMVYATPAFIVSSSDKLASSWNSKKSNLVKISFSYDRHKNVTEIKYALNDQHLCSKVFVYEYY